MRLLLVDKIRKCVSPAKFSEGKKILLNSYNFPMTSYEGLNIKTSLQHYSTASNFLGTSYVKDISIPVSFGHIAAKAWGKDTGYPILAFHGWLDNCGTFDTLFPLLLDKFYIVALDFPGHGLSSHKAPGSFYTDISSIMDSKKVADFLGWQKFSIIGHSMGGAIALMFSSIFPENIDKLVILDIVKPSSRAVHLFPSETMKAVKNLLEIEKKLSKPAPIYTEESAAERLHRGMFGEVTLEGAKILNKRGTRPSECGKGVIFNRDLRCRPIEQFSRRSHEFVLQFMSAVKCELLMIMAKNTHPNYATATPEVIDSFYDVYRKNAKRFILENVEGNHFVHLNNPERVAPIINDFLST